MIHPIEEIIADFHDGKMIIMMDDKNRENEGDIMMSAAQVDAADINFMATHARGLICITLTRRRCQRLNLPLMVSNSREGTNFTVSIDARTTSTGISAAERATTINLAVDPDADADDFIQPGHIFPLMARDGGTLIRAGHTEAGCDLSRFAGEEEPSAVIVEIMNPDGTMARLPDLEAFSSHHGLKLGTIADLIRYRLQKESFMKHLNRCNFPTVFGDFSLHSYLDTIEQRTHLALTYGDYTTPTSTVVRVSTHSLVYDVLQGTRSNPSWGVAQSMQKIAENGHGVIVLLNPTESEQQLSQMVADWVAEDEGRPFACMYPEDTRTFGKGAAILVDLGVRKMQVLGSPWGNNSFSGFNLEVCEFISGTSTRKPPARRKQ